MADANLLHLIATGGNQQGVGTFSAARVRGEQIASSQQDRQMKMADRQRSDQVNQLVGAAIGGDENAKQQLMSIDPDIGMKVDAYGKQQAAFGQQHQAMKAGRVKLVLDKFGPEAAQKAWEYESAEPGYENWKGQFDPARVTQIAAGGLSQEQQADRMFPKQQQFAPDHTMLQVPDGKGGFTWQPRAKAAGMAAPAPKGMGGPAPGNTGFTTDKRGQMVAPAGRKLTDGESKSLTYSRRATGALQTIDSLENTFGPGKGTYSPGGARDRFAEWLPSGNVIKSESGQKYDQAAKEFITAILRKDSGATITPQEMSEQYSIYFPVYGDGPGVRQQKSQARQRALSALNAGLGAGIADPNDQPQQPGVGQESPDPQAQQDNVDALVNYYLNNGQH